MWTRPTPDRDESWVKPSYVPPPQQQPIIQPREEPRPLYAPAAPEFRPSEAPDKTTEMPEGPKMPGERGSGDDGLFLEGRRGSFRCFFKAFAVACLVQSPSLPKSTNPLKTKTTQSTKERRPDPIPAGNPKERPSEGGGQEERREAPPPGPDKK
jgi:hypothetical protein